MIETDDKKKVYVAPNVDDVDFVTNQMDYEKVRDCLQRDIVGKEFINLSPSFF